MAHLPRLDAHNPELRRLFDAWVASDAKVRLLAFFHRNPGIMETLEGLARRMGTTPKSIEDAVADEVAVGILKQVRIGGQTVIVYDADQERKLQARVAARITKRLEEAGA
ncbi:MAG: hypothetical protein R3185_02565 [Candidatus Thermoplasmatota archaeon]|nr:hypothetical protein [Candidatus Thermoplasmatota archaeon]